MPCEMLIETLMMSMGLFYYRASLRMMGVSEVCVCVCVCVYSRTPYVSMQRSFLFIMHLLTSYLEGLSLAVGIQEA
jgi:hypothetical protein